MIEIIFFSKQKRKSSRARLLQIPEDLALKTVKKLLDYLYASKMISFPGILGLLQDIGAN